MPREVIQNTFKSHDMTGQYDPNLPTQLAPYDKHYKIAEGSPYPDKNDEFWTPERVVVATQVWDLVSQKFQEKYGSKPAPFDLKMFYATIIPESNTSVAEIQTDDGQMFFDIKHCATLPTLAKSIAHEAGHFYAKRRLISSPERHMSVRSGLRVMAHYFFTPMLTKEGVTKELVNHNFSMSVFDEAATEIETQNFLQQIAAEIPELKDEEFKPSAYEEARIILDTLIKNIVLAWNHPEFRPNRLYDFMGDQSPSAHYRTPEYRQARKEQLNLPSQISYEDVEELIFASAWKQGINNFASLVEYTLGEKAFSELVKINISLHPEKPFKNVNIYDLWKVISAPEKAKAFSREESKIDVTVLPNLKFTVATDTIPEKYPIGSYRESTERIRGVTDVFANYAQLFLDAPDKTKEKEELVEFFLNEGIMLFAYRGDGSAFLRLNDRIQQWCFEKLVRELHVTLKQPNKKYSYTQPDGMKVHMEYFQIPDSNEFELLKIHIKNEDLNDSFTLFTPVRI